MNDELPQHYGNSAFLIALTIVGVVTVGFALLFRAAMAPMPRAVSPQLGKQFPPIEAAGWINGDGPSADDLRGKVAVVDAWAFWCEPCREATPQLIEVYDKYKDRGVTFIGLTSLGEDAGSLQKSRQYVKSLKIPWVNGYAAIKPLLALDVETIPQLWVIDRQNRIVFHEIGWSEDSIRDLKQALDQALKGSP